MPAEGKLNFRVVVIGRAIKVAASEWRISQSRAAGKTPYPAPGRAKRLQGDEHVHSIADCTTDHRASLLRALVTVAIESAMRRGELLALRWQDVDLEIRVVHLLRSKNRYGRDVPLSHRAFAALKELNPTGQRPGHEFPVTGDYVRSAFERLVARTGTLDLRFHDLLHEAISRSFEMRLNPIEVATISGHRELRMLQRYTHLRSTDLAPRLDRSRAGGPS